MTQGNYSMGAGIGFAQDKKAKDEMNTGVPGGGQPRQRNVVVQAQSDRTTDFMIHNLNNEDANLEFVVKGGTHAVTGDVVDTGNNAATWVGTTLFRNIVPGTLVITSDNEDWADNGDGTLTGDAGGTGTVDYVTGIINLDYFTTSGAGDVTAAYSHTDWSPLATPVTFVVVAGAGDVTKNLLPTLGDNYADSIKNNALIGLAAWALNQGTQLNIRAYHTGNDENYKLENPEELLRGPIDDKLGPQTIGP